MILYVDNDNAIRLDRLKNALTDAFVNNATVSAQLKNAAGASVGSAVTLTYVTASDGRYQGAVESSVDISMVVLVTVTATTGGGLNASWDEAVTVVRRRNP